MIKNFQMNNNFASYRVFETLKFILKAPATIAEIAEYLEGIDCEQKNYSKSVIYKYVATLKFAGINIMKSKGKYFVNSLPFKLNFTKDEIYALSVLHQTCGIIAEQDLKQSLEEFLYSLKMRYSEKVIDEINELSKEHKLSLPTLSTDDSETIKKLEKICKDKQKIKISYKDIYGEKIIATSEAIEVRHINNKILFLFYDIQRNNFVEQESTSILKIEQIPSKISEKYSSTTTVFKLKNKLSKRYTLRNEEKIWKVENNGDIVIGSQKEAKDVLFRRLMRYGEECELLTPKYNREEMHLLIKKTLENYQ